MAIAVSEIRPVAHLPLVLGMVRKLEVATVIDTLIVCDALGADRAWDEHPSKQENSS
jgi:hypothetical protein